MQGDTEHQKILRCIAGFPSGTVHAEQQLPWRRQDQQEGKENGLGELRAPANAFNAALLRLNESDSRKKGA